ncbi:hypothetical protein BSKO_13091 [Bryopsis sp. KO-2023]|nr:hypothetical protein BSKO_13091 [Bryopsis sp. KO-2023]
MSIIGIGGQLLPSRVLKGCPSYGVSSATSRLATLTRRANRFAPLISPSQRSREQVLECTAAAATSTTAPEDPVEESEEIDEKFPPKASKQLSRAIFALRRYGWLGFWSQLALSLTSSVVLIFSVAFTAEAGPQIALYLTTFSTIASFIATFKSFMFVRTSRKMQEYLEAPPGVEVQKVTKEQVVNSLFQSASIAVIGLGSAIVGLQASVGLLLAKTLTNTTANPFLSGGAGSWNPVLAFDVFLLQASTNTTLSHFIGLVLSLWMMVKLREKSLWQILFG